MVAHVHVKLTRGRPGCFKPWEHGVTLSAVKVFTVASIQSSSVRVVSFLLSKVSVAHGNRYPKESTKKGGTEVRLVLFF